MGMLDNGFSPPEEVEEVVEEVVEEEDYEYDPELEPREFNKEPLCLCGRDFKPVCAKGREFSNECLAKCEFGQDYAVPHHCKCSSVSNGACPEGDALLNDFFGFGRFPGFGMDFEEAQEG